MSQRLAKDQARRMLLALGIPNLRGGEGDENGATGGNGESGENGNSNQQQNQNSGQDGGDPDPDDDDESDEDVRKQRLYERLEKIKDPKDRRIVELSDENATKRHQIKELKTELAAKEAELEKYKRKERTELENSTRDLQVAQEALTKRDKVLRNNLLETAILKNDAFTWHDVSDVVRALDQDAVTVDLDEGTIEGLGPELKRIASEKPHYVKAKKSDKKNDNGNNGGNGGQRGASGINPGGTGSPNNAANAQRAELLKKYPSLARR